MGLLVWLIGSGCFTACGISVGWFAALPAGPTSTWAVVRGTAGDRLWNRCSGVVLWFGYLENAHVAEIVPEIVG
ncbi:hypothetical protein GCM10027444_19790 [Actinopolyspora lacussalsi]